MNSIPASTSFTRASEKMLSINVDTKLITLVEHSTHGQVLAWVNQISHPKFNGLDHLDYITQSCKLWVDMKMSTSTTFPRTSEGLVDLRSFDRTLFCSSLLSAVSDVSSGLVIDKNLIEKVKAFSIEFDLEKSIVEERTCMALLTLESEYPFATAAELAECYLLLVKKLPDKWKALYERCPFMNNDIHPVQRTSNISDFTVGLLKICRIGRSIFRVAESFGAGTVYSASTKCSSTDGSRIQKRAASEQSGAISTASSTRTCPPTFQCWGCGTLGHAPVSCPFRGHENFNRNNIPWAQSAGGKFWKDKGFDTLHATKPPTSSSSSSSSSSFSTTRPNRPWTQRRGMDKILSSLSSIPSSDLLLCRVSLSSQISTRLKGDLETLIDTGSLAGNFISEAAFHRLDIASAVKLGYKRVCSGLDNTCIELKETIDLFVFLPCETNLNGCCSFFMKVFLLKDSPIDLIIGRESIKLYDLFTYVPSQISRTGHNETDDFSSVQRPTHLCGSCTCSENLQPYEHSPGKIVLPTLTTGSDVISTLVDPQDSFTETPSSSYEDTHGTGAFEPFLSTPFDETDLLSQLNISGSPSLRKRIMDLCTEFRTLFSNTLSSIPAKLKPFELIVDEKKWEVPANRSPPRKLSPEKEAEVQKQVTELLGAGIIEKSDASFYSQVLLVPKPGTNVWRMCVDYRNMNSCTKPNSWPIPHIDSMLRRIGSKHGKYFATMDLTQGYHQASVALGSRIYTAFILFCGLYQFTRLPFGPKRASSYFQEQMASVVLAGLLYFICEVYLDDITVFGSTEDEFIKNLRTVFVR